MEIYSVVSDLMAEMREPPDSVEPVRELVRALQLSDTTTRAYLLSEIGGYLPQYRRAEVWKQAIAATSAIQHSPDQLNVLKHLAPKLPTELLPSVFDIGKTIFSEVDRTRALQFLAPELPAPLLLEALSAARVLRSEYCRAFALSALVAWLPENLRAEVSLEALEVARSVRLGGFGSVYYVGALGAVAESLSDVALQTEVFEEALAVARGIDGENGLRSIALSDLVSKLPKALKAEVIEETLDTIVTARESWTNTKALSGLVSELLPNLLPRALTAARAIQGGNRAIALVALAAELPNLVNEAFAAIENARSECTCVSALAALAPKLPPQLLLKAVLMAKGFRSERDRIATLIALASPLSKMQRRKLFPLWQTILQALSSQAQQDFCHSVLALTAVVCRLRDPEAAAETVVSLLDSKALSLQNRQSIL